MSPTAESIVFFHGIIVRIRLRVDPSYNSQCRVTPSTQMTAIIYMLLLQIRLEGRDKVESRVSLTACVIVYYCLPAVGVFSKLVWCICIYGFNLVFCYRV